MTDNYGDPIPVTLLAPGDVVYLTPNIDGRLGILSDDGAVIDHEEVTLYFVFRKPYKLSADSMVYVPNQDHTVIDSAFRS